MTYTLYASPDSFNVVPEMVLAELQVDYKRHELNRATGEQRSASYKNLNPQGLIPTLTDGDLTLFETAAICVHLAEQWGSLLPAQGTPERSHVFKWLFFLSNTLHADLRIFWYTDKYSKDPDSHPAIRDAIKERVLKHLTLIEKQLERNAASPQAYLACQHLTIADFYLAHCLRTACVYPLDAPMFNNYLTRPILHKWLEAMQERASVQTAYHKNGVTKTPLTAPQKPDAINDPNQLVG